MCHITIFYRYKVLNIQCQLVRDVPQGTALGPLLFMVLLSDIDSDTESDIISFADDTRIYLGVNYTNSSENFKYDLDTIYLWADQNNMQFNSLKFNLLSLTHRCPSSNIYLTKDKFSSRITISRYFFYVR